MTDMICHKVYELLMSILSSFIIFCWIMLHFKDIDHNKHSKDITYANAIQ
jgi:L-asparagine transporter-like permease